MNKGLQALQDHIKDWQAKTFPTQPLKGKLAHLISEARELRDNPDDPTEWADVVILLLGAAAHNGMDVNDLYRVALLKFCVAKDRKWGPMNAEGFCHHEETLTPGSSRIGRSYVFMREGHDWHFCEVSVLAIKGNKFVVARCCDVADGLLAKPGSRKRKLKTWTCTEEELW